MIAASKANATIRLVFKCNVGFADEDCSRKLRCPNANETFMCNGRGECHEDLKGEASGIYDGVCKCKEPFSGKSCELQPCKASEDGKECYGRGTCDKSTGLCACEQGFAGQGCELQCDKKCNGISLFRQDAYPPFVTANPVSEASAARSKLAALETMEIKAHAMEMKLCKRRMPLFPWIQW